MRHTRLRQRRHHVDLVTAIGVAFAASLMLAGCAPASDSPLPVPTTTTSVTPQPTATPGSDPEADVKNAIKTYEAYVAASNNIDLADRTTWEPVLDLTTGKQHEATVASLESMRDKGQTFVGSTRVLNATVFGVDEDRVVLDVCIDESAFDMLDPAGVSVLPPGRDLTPAVRVRVVPSDPPVTWRIDYMTYPEDQIPC